MALAFFLGIFVFFAVFLELRRLLQFQSKAEEETSPLPISVPTPTRSLWDYDVFLSFRGKDTRVGFLSHLYRALSDEGIRTFCDEKELLRGNSIWSGLEEAIRASRVAVVVLSESFATSRWCLEELSLIAECENKNNLKLIPVFYGIDPSHVKTQSGSFAKAFEEHEQRYDRETVERWRKALAQVGKISGWDSRNWNEESKLVRELVRDLSNRFPRPSSRNTGEFVGMSSHMRDIDPLLCLDSEDVRMVGIWGMGGVGKSTVAKFVYDHYSGSFHGACLLQNVKGVIRQRGPSHLRKKILSNIFLKKVRNVREIDSGAVEQRLCGKKVLLVLDDVDDIEQLQELAGSPAWFGPRSRVIITTRDKRVLDQHDVKHIYEVKPLMTVQALQLFSKHAFNQPLPREEFMELSIDVVKQLGGLPLALKVVGRHLYLREIEYWKQKMPILQHKVDNSISKALRESYEALDEREKTIFLYVACCFNGEYMERVKGVLDLFVLSSACRPLPSSPGIIALKEKCLIHTSKKRLWVHDLLQDMARDIICEHKEAKPWKRMMLWSFEDINNVFLGNMGGEAIEVECISLDMSQGKELYISPTVFKRMFNLKLLKFYNNSAIGGSKTRMPDGLDFLPMLRYLYWDAYTLKSLPSGFCTDYLVELNLPDSSLERLWDGTQDLGNLQRVNLNRCRSLVEIPNLSKAKNLRSLHLSDCESLVELPASLGHLNKLIELSARNCTRLESTPNNINMESLRFLHLDGCSSLKDFPLVSENIETLGLSNTAIEQVPPSIQRLSRLASLRFSGCTKLKNLPDTIRNLGSLEYLWLANCPRVTMFPEVGNEIKMVHLNGTAIEEVPATIGDKKKLLVLDMSRCKRLGNLPRTLRNLANLKFLYLRGCIKITERPETAGRMRALDLYGTSIEQYPSLSEVEELQIHDRQAAFSKEVLLRSVRRYTRNRRSD